LAEPPGLIYSSARSTGLKKSLSNVICAFVLTTGFSCKNGANISVNERQARCAADLQDNCDMPPKENNSIPSGEERSFVAG